jgi:hypothetical protein
MLKTFEWVAVLAVVVLLLSIAGISYLSSPPPGQPREQQATAQAEAEQQGEKQHSLRGFIRFMFPDAISVFTFWLTLATIALGVVAVLQIGFLDRSERIAAETAKAAKESADATRDAVKLSDKTAQRQLRAYVYVDKAVVTLEGRKLKGLIELKNTGQTPAYDAVTVTQFDTQEVGRPFIPRPFGVVPLDKVIIGPGGIVSPETELEIPTDNEAAIPAFKEGRGIVYLTGQTRYVDAFQRTWVLDFRMRSHAFEPARNRWILSPTEDGNTERQEN